MHHNQEAKKPIQAHNTVCRSQFEHVLITMFSNDLRCTDAKWHSYI